MDSKKEGTAFSGFFSLFAFAGNIRGRGNSNGLPIGRDDGSVAGALISAINWAEVLANLVVAGGDPNEITAMAAPGADIGRLDVVPFGDEDARVTARLGRRTQHLGLSLSDRAALALAQQRACRVLTTDRTWRSLRLPITIEVIR